MCDYLSRFLLLFLLCRAAAAAVIILIEENVFLLFGVPEYLRSNQGVQYQSKEFKLKQ